MVRYQHHHHELREDDELTSYSPSPPPWISFSSSELLDEEDFISINPKRPSTSNNNSCNGEFQFPSGKGVGAQTNTMKTADELFYDGKLLPFWQKQPCGVTETNEKFRSNNSTGRIKMTDVEEVEAKAEEGEQIFAVKSEENKRASGNTSHPSWYLDEGPSPRPPKCTVLWKELLRLKKRRGSSSLSPSSSSSSTSSSSSSMADVGATADNGKEAEGSGNLREMYLQKIKRGLEKTRTGSIRIRPIASLPVCKHVRTNSNGGGLPPLFPMGKGRSL